jgi:hypothetical protein
MITRDLPFDEYLVLPGEHFSTLKALDVSPIAYRHACDNERGDTDALRIGRLAHSMILTPGLPDGVAVYDGPVRRGKVWDAFEAANAGKEIVRLGEINGAMRMRDAVMAHPKARELLSDGDPEVSFTWDDTGIACKGRVDFLRPGGGIVELKTTRVAGKRAFDREFAARLYHAQAAFYVDGYATASEYDVNSCHMIVVQNVAPYDVGVLRIGGDVIEAGRRKVAQWLESLRVCQDAGQWSGAWGDGIEDVELPEWAEADGLPDVDMSGIEEVT